MSDRDLDEPLSPEAEEASLKMEKVKLEEELIALRDAENTSTACRRICSVVVERQGQDTFLANDGVDGGEGRNPYHSSPPTKASAGSDQGCCVVL